MSPLKAVNSYKKAWELLLLLYLGLWTATIQIIYNSPRPVLYIWICIYNRAWAFVVYHPWIAWNCPDFKYKIILNAFIHNHPSIFVRGATARSAFQDGNKGIKKVIKIKDTT